MDDLISRQAAIEAILHNQELYSNNFGNDPIDRYTIAIIDNDAHTIAQLPSVQPNLSEAYGKAVFTWLMDYQIRAADLKGRYTPYEVLSWVINDWRKEHG